MYKRHKAHSIGVLELEGERKWAIPKTEEVWD